MVLAVGAAADRSDRTSQTLASQGDRPRHRRHGHLRTCRTHRNIGRTLGSGFSAKVKEGIQADGSKIALKIFAKDKPNFNSEFIKLCETEIEKTLAASGLDLNENVEIHNARVSERNVEYANYLYERLQRNGFLLRDCQRMVNQDRNVFAACMVSSGDADAVVTGLTRNFSVALDNVRRAIDHQPGHRGTLRHRPGQPPGAAPTDPRHATHAARVPARSTSVHRVRPAGGRPGCPDGLQGTGSIPKRAAGIEPENLGHVNHAGVGFGCRHRNQAPSFVAK